MRLSFRQGVVSYQSSSGVQDFLDVNVSGNIDLQANNRPVTVTLAHKDKDYTYTEDFTVTDAWTGPFTSGLNYWLYWDFNLLTFERTFGYTLLEPIAQELEPGHGNVDVVSVIPGTSPGIGAFVVDGHFILDENYSFAIVGSENGENDGTYLVVQTVYDTFLGQTTISVSQDVVAPTGDLGEATLDIDYQGFPLLSDGRHWYNTQTKRHYVRNNDSWVEVLRVFAGRFNGTNQFLSLSDRATNADFTGTQTADNASVRAGRVIFDEASDPLRRDDRSFFTTEDQFFANASRVDAIRLESNVVRAQLIDPAAAAYSIVAWEEDGRVTAADYNDIGKTVIGLLTEDLLINEVGSVIIQGVITNPDWNWTTGVDKVPVGNPLWIENGQLIAYDPHSYLNRDTTPIQNVQNGSSGQFFEVAGAYTLSKGSVIAVKDNSANNDGNYTVVEAVFSTLSGNTTIFVEEIVIDPVASGNILLTVGNFPIARVPVARVLDKDTVVFEQGLGGVGDSGPPGSLENIPVATTTENGSVFLNIPADVPEIPIVVGDNDPRLSDARFPLSHQHAATDVTFSPAFSISSLNVQGAIEELSFEKLNLDGGIMSGTLTLNANPTAALHATTKQYVDSLVSGLIWIEPVDYIDLVDDSLSIAPAAPEDSDMYIIANPGPGGAAFPAGWNGQTAGDVMRWSDQASEWEFIDHISNFTAETRFGVTILSGSPASGTFLDKHIYELTTPGTAGIYDSTWTIGPEMPPQLNHAFFVKNQDSFHAFNQFVYDGTKWIKFGGGSSLAPDNTTISQTGNVISVKQWIDGGIVDSKFWQGLEPTDLALIYSPLGHIHAASTTTFAPYTSSIPDLGDITATDTQAAVEEVFDKKGNLQPNYATFGDLPDPVLYTGMLAYVIADSAHYMAEGGSWLRVGTYPQSIPYDISYFIAGQMIFSNTPVGVFVAPRQIELETGLPGAVARARVAPAANVTYTLVTDDGTTVTPVGTVDFVSGNRNGTFTLPAPVTLVSGVSLEMVTPVTLDPSIQDVAVTVVGCAQAGYCG